MCSVSSQQLAVLLQEYPIGKVNGCMFQNGQNVHKEVRPMYFRVELFINTHVIICSEKFGRSHMASLAI